MMEMKRNWKFTVRCEKELLIGECLCISGSDESLGNWKPKDMIRMTMVESDGYSSIWECDVMIPSDKSVYYRYCIGYFIETAMTFNENPPVIIREWETDITPRKISSKDYDQGHIATYGVISVSRNIAKTQQGWLTEETLVEFKLQENAVSLWKKKHSTKFVFIRISGLESSQCGSTCDHEESLDFHADQTHRNKIWPIIEVAKLGDSKYRIPTKQGQFGTCFSEGDFISFYAYVLDLSTVAFLLDFYTHDSPELQDGEVPKHVGSCYVMPDHLKSTEGKCTVPIVSRGFQAIGKFHASYLVVYPIKDMQCDLAVSFALHWRPVWKGLDVGHRGSGNSFTNLQDCSAIRENTIASLRNAFNHGADMVEFDVQISKDLVPVIYHDFHLCTTVAHKKNQDEKFLVEMPLKNLTLEQLQKLKIHNLHEKDAGLKEFIDDEDHDPFPTLERALNVIKEDGGFNIEIKWDMELKDGSRENHNPVEINLFTDIVIKTVLTHGKSRPIVFSSFNPDICTVLRKKQNQYPVLLLTVGINTKYESYLDSRTWNISRASDFVDMVGILGINAMAEDIERDPSQVELVKSRNQVLFCWTDDKNDKATVERMKEVGIDGVVFDRMDAHKSHGSSPRRFTLVSDYDDEEERQFINEVIFNKSSQSTKKESEKDSSLSFSGLLNRHVSSLS